MNGMPTRSPQARGQGLARQAPARKRRALERQAGQLDSAAGARLDIRRPPDQTQLHPWQPLGSIPGRRAGQ